MASLRCMLLQTSWCRWPPRWRRSPSRQAGNGVVCGCRHGMARTPAAAAYRRRRRHCGRVIFWCTCAMRQSLPTACAHPTTLLQLLIMDSIMANLRTDFCGRGELAERQQRLGQLMARLRKVRGQFSGSGRKQGAAAAGRHQHCRAGRPVHHLAPTARRCLRSSTWRWSSPTRSVPLRFAQQPASCGV